MSALLDVRHIFKSYDNAPLLRDISFQVAPGEIVSLLGPSGTGKTTLLRIIAGLESAEAGQVWFGGRDMNGVPVHRREFGLMFQDLALFPHRTVGENVAFGLRMQNLPSEEIQARVKEALELVGLEPGRFARRDVNHLSGGEQQRVALARALAPRPRLLMLDEPLGALDRILREQLVGDLHRLLKQIGMTAIYVTHDQEEAFGIADRLVIVNKGRIEQMGAPLDLYEHPANGFVARFLGLSNLVPAEVTAREGERIRARSVLGELLLVSDRSVGTRGIVLIRPDAAQPGGVQPETDANRVHGTVVETILRSGRQWVVLDSAGLRLSLEWEAPARAGQSLALYLNSDSMEWLPSTPPD